MKQRLQSIKTIIDTLRWAKKYLTDAKVSTWQKFLLVFPLLYFISPVDLLSDYPLLGLGWLDDTVIGLTVWRYVYTNLIDYKKQSKEQAAEDDEQADYTLRDDEYDVN